jgi:UDP-N-acetylglucosamine 2-epimerase
MRIVSVVGARPNFMRIGAVLAGLRGMPKIEHCLVHIGQHYDRRLSDILRRFTHPGTQHQSEEARAAIPGRLPNDEAAGACPSRLRHDWG